MLHSASKIKLVLLAELTAEQVTVAVTLDTCVREAPGSNLNGTYAIMRVSWVSSASISNDKEKIQLLLQFTYINLQREKNSAKINP